MNSADIDNKTPAFIETEGDRFEILTLLGSGGMGTVYKARQESLARIVAVKLLRARDFSPQATLRLRREAMTASTVDHPNVVKVYSLLSYQDQPFIVMEYIDGRCLNDVLSESGTLPYSEMIGIFMQILDALTAIHAVGLVHRDIKPSNIIVTTGGTAKLMDFGVAKQVSDSSQQRLTQTGAMVGSPWFMSPEQCSGSEVDARSDIYSLGCTMYQAVSGHAPFASDNPIEVMFGHLNEQAETLSGQTDPRLAEVIARAMAKEKADRFQSAAEFKEALEECLSAPPPGSINAKKGKRRSRRKANQPAITLRVVAVSLGTISILAAAMYFFASGSAPELDEKPVSVTANTNPYEVPAFKQIEPNMSAGRLRTITKEIMEQLDASRAPEAARKEQWARLRGIVQQNMAHYDLSRDQANLSELFGALTVIAWRADDQDLSAKSAYQCAKLAQSAFEADPYTQIQKYNGALRSLHRQGYEKQFEEILALALDLGKRTVKRGNNDPEAALHLANARSEHYTQLYTQNKYKLAEQVARTAIQESHNAHIDTSWRQVQNRANLVEALKMQGRLQEAAKEYEDTIKAYPNPPFERDVVFESLRRLAHLGCDIYAQQKDRKKFDQAFRDTLRFAKLGCPPESQYYFVLKPRMSNDYYTTAGLLRDYFNDLKAATVLAKQSVELQREAGELFNPNGTGFAYLDAYLGFLHVTSAPIEEVKPVVADAQKLATLCNSPVISANATYWDAVLDYRQEKYASAQKKFEAVAATPGADLAPKRAGAMNFIQRIHAHKGKETQQ